MKKRILYDSSNRFCQDVIHWIEKADEKHIFMCSSMEGKKAKMLFQGNYRFLRQKRSIVLVEGNRVWVRSNAVFRAFWLTGGKWKYLGILFWLPGFFLNPLFRLMTRIWR